MILKDSWAGLGFGSNMTKADINFIESYNNGTFTLHDSYSQGYAPPSDDTKLGGTFDFKNIKSFTDSKGNLNITFERLFDTKDAYDEIVYPVIFFYFK